MRNLYGPPVSGEDFFGRDDQLRRAIAMMQDGNSFLLLGIRRTGKSSFLKEVRRNLENNPENTCMALDCNHYRNVLQFYQGLYKAMPKTLGDRFRKVLTDTQQLPSRLLDWVTNYVTEIEVDGIGKVGLHNDWIVYVKPLEEAVSRFFEREKNVFLFLDELPFFFENLRTDEEDYVHHIETMLASLRIWRDSGVPMGIAGSLNIYLQLDSVGISRKLLAGLNSVRLEPFSRDDGRRLFEQLANSKKALWWNLAVSEKLLDILPDYLPYFLQFSFHHLYVDHCNEPEKVEEIYHNYIYPGLLRDFVYQFEERLKVFSGENFEPTALLLDFVAARNTTTLDYLQDYTNHNFRYDLLVQLLDYEFLTLDGEQRYRFSLDIIRQWWRQKRNIEIL